MYAQKWEKCVWGGYFPCWIFEHWEYFFEGGWQRTKGKEKCLFLFWGYSRNSRSLVKKGIHIRKMKESFIQNYLSLFVLRLFAIIAGMNLQESLATTNPPKRSIVFPLPYTNNSLGVQRSLKRSLLHPQSLQICRHGFHPFPGVSLQMRVLDCHFLQVHGVTLHGSGQWLSKITQNSPWIGNLGTPPRKGQRQFSNATSFKKTTQMESGSGGRTQMGESKACVLMSLLLPPETSAPSSPGY